MRPSSSRLRLGVFGILTSVAVIAACVGDDEPIPAESSRNDGGANGSDGSVVPGADGGTGSSDGGGEAGPSSCVVTDPIVGEPELVGGINLPGSRDRGARLSPDQTTVYFGSTRDGPDRVYYATRGSTSAPFGGANMLLSDGRNTDNPIVTADHLTLFVNTTGIVAGAENIRSNTRGNPSALFGSVELVAGVANAAGSKEPYVTPDGARLYYSTGGQIMVAERQGTTYANPAPALTPPAQVGYTHPVVSADERVIWVAKRENNAPLGIFRATRGSTTAAFGTPEVVADLNAKLPAWPSWISADGCTMYLTAGHVINPSLDAGGPEVHVFRAVRQPR